MTRRSTLGTSLGAVAMALTAAGAGVATYATAVERNAFRVRNEVLPVLDPGARPLTVLHIADLHMAPWQRAKQDWVRSLVHLEPDLVVNTGDNIGHAEGLSGVKRALEPFKGIPGVFVHGSNDYFAPVVKNPLRYLTGPSKSRERSPELDIAPLDEFFEGELGWLSLDNTARAMTINGSNIEFFGTADAHRGWDRLDRLAREIDEMRENVGWQHDAMKPETVRIAVTHAPYQRVLNSFVTQGADLIFAGHTHGGQVCVPGVGALVTNCDLPRSLASGLTVWRHARGASYLNVSAGIGTSIYAPVRFACPPEAVLLTLTPADIGYS
ncbi:metallophosphoesterase [Klugiella sp. YN-L-19]|uniref:Metallophosphoesterase n=2 Tax=Ruicaihuangia caeni TaxID=3042517 RepID=A0AAW6T6X1_9MICO|nr:metallophosphoesterase [Klugiella sp. YN-L-19]MDI2099254.1 metallophosphoesterase [Klugiella sp. YN-L-19]